MYPIPCDCLMLLQIAATISVELLVRVVQAWAYYVLASPSPDTCTSTFGLLTAMINELPADFLGTAPRCEIESAHAAAELEHVLVLTRLTWRLHKRESTNQLSVKLDMKAPTIKLTFHPYLSVLVAVPVRNHAPAPAPARASDLIQLSSTVAAAGWTSTVAPSTVETHYTSQLIPLQW